MNSQNSDFAIIVLVEIESYSEEGRLEKLGDSDKGLGQNDQETLGSTPECSFIG